PPFPPQGPPPARRPTDNVPAGAASAWQRGSPVQLRACLANALQGNLVAQGGAGHRLWCRSDLRRITHPPVSTQQPTASAVDVAIGLRGAVGVAVEARLDAIEQGDDPADEDQHDDGGHQGVLDRGDAALSPGGRLHPHPGYSERVRPAGWPTAAVRRGRIRDDGSSGSSGAAPAWRPPPPSNRPGAGGVPGRAETTSGSGAATSVPGRGA